MTVFHVLYREDSIPALAPPEAFRAEADDSDHAEEQCTNAYPGCEVLWVVETDDPDEARRKWWNCDSNFPSHLDPTEAEIAGRILDKALANGLSITVHDDQDYIVRSTDRAAIEAEIGASGMSVLTFFDGSRSLGWVCLIHGNGRDLISDYSANDWMDEFIQPIMELYC